MHTQVQENNLVLDAGRKTTSSVVGFLFNNGAVENVPITLSSNSSH